MDDSLGYGALLSLALATGLLAFAVRSAMKTVRMTPLGVLLVTGGLAWALEPVQWMIDRLAGLTFETPRAMVENWAITNSPGRHLYFWASDGVFWALVYLCLRRTTLGTWARRIAALVITRYLFVSYEIVAVVLYLRIDRPYMLESPGLLRQIAINEIKSATNGYGIATTLLLLWLVARWSGGPVNRKADNPAQAVGTGGLIMSKRENQATRLLCASVLLHAGARRSLLDWLKDKNRAVALELGVDLELAARVARFAEKRERKATWIYFGLLCATAVCALITPVLGVIGVLAAAVVFFVRTIEERSQFAPMFWAHNFDAEKVRDRFKASLEPADVNGLPRADQNFFVFGDFTPFVGAGVDLGGWSVVIALDKPRVDFGAAQEIHSFAVHDVYDAIDAGLDHLQVRNIEKADAFFARGTDVRGDHDLLPDLYGRPVQNLPPAVAGRYIFRDDEKVRHYRCYRVQDWGGELALSYYIRCSCRGNTLFIETKRFILTPLQEQFRAVDSMTPMRAAEKIVTLVGGVVAGPVLMVASPFQLLARMNHAVEKLFGREEKVRREMLTRTPLFNYGAKTSLRQWLSSGNYGHYFQKMDGDLYNKLFEHEVLDSLVEFLDAHGVDTSELKERQTTILNNGVMVQGGDVNTESLAVGAGARALKKVQSMVSAPVAAGSKQ